MNLFILDEDPVIAASLNCDIHVNKIILEAASCMCAAHWEYGFPNLDKAPKIFQDGKYRGKTHHNNHITKWVRESRENYRWTYKHAIELCNQHTLRSKYKRQHATRELIEWLGNNEPPILLEPMTPFRQAVAEECYHDNPVVAYWVYYVTCKAHLAYWTTPVPSWYLSLRLSNLRGATTPKLLKEAEALYESREKTTQMAA